MNTPREPDDESTPDAVRARRVDNGPARPAEASACPVAAIAARMAATRATEDVAQEAGSHADEHGAARSRASTVERAASDRHESLRLAATLERAQTAQGALLQVGIAHSALDFLMEALDARFDAEERASACRRLAGTDTLADRGAFYERREARDAHRQLVRLLYSLSHFIRSLPGGDDCKAAEYFMSTWLDPFDVALGVSPASEMPDEPTTPRNVTPLRVA